MGLVRAPLQADREPPAAANSGDAGGAAWSRARSGLFAAGAVLLALVLWGGYSHHWPWTGINGGTATLWDWLHLLLLPVAVGVLPIWMSRKLRLRRRIKSAALGFAGGFGLVVVLGYAVPWAWTGFTGNSLWDWLNLVALPLAVALTPLAQEIHEGWAPRHTTVAVAAAAAFTAVVLGGYLDNWSWTGFSGNTLWDWLHLLLLPLLLPTVVVPALMPMAKASGSAVDAGQSAAGGAEDTAAGSTPVEIQQVDRPRALRPEPGIETDEE